MFRELELERSGKGIGYVIARSFCVCVCVCPAPCRPPVPRMRATHLRRPGPSARARPVPRRLPVPFARAVHFAHAVRLWRVNVFSFQSRLGSILLTKWRANLVISLCVGLPFASSLSLLPCP